MVAVNEFSPNTITKGDLFTSTNVADFPVPHGRDEVWRFISLRQLRGLHNGEFAPAVEQSVSVTTHPGVAVERVTPEDPRLGRAGAPADRVAAQAWTAMKSGEVITIDADTVVEEAVVVTVTGQGEGVTSFGATSIEIGQNSQATVVLRYVGSGTHADNVEFILGDGAHLTVIVDVDWNNDALHLSNQIAQLGRDAVLRHNVAIFGGQIVRLVPRVNFTGPGGDAELLGVYFANAGQYFENRLLVDHSVAHCRSNVLYKGALQGHDSIASEGDSAAHEGRSEARTCWVGDVLIRPTAQGTDTYETNNNLILSEGARADAIPNLEISTGEIVGAGHAATVGRFDDIELFYLMSRGIPEAEARRLIIRGFFNEVIYRIPVESVQQDLETRIAEELEKIK